MSRPIPACALVRDLLGSKLALDGASPPSFNLSYEARANHHPTIREMDLLTKQTVACIDETFMNRWRTLMSVDDVIRDTFELVDSMGLTNNTYFLYSSDHGFRLGECEFGCIPLKFV